MLPSSRPVTSLPSAPHFFLPLAAAAASFSFFCSSRSFAFSFMSSSSSSTTVFFALFSGFFLPPAVAGIGCRRISREDQAILKGWFPLLLQRAARTVSRRHRAYRLATSLRLVAPAAGEMPGERSTEGFAGFRASPVGRRSGGQGRQPATACNRLQQLATACNRRRGDERLKQPDGVRTAFDWAAPQGKMRARARLTAGPNQKFKASAISKTRESIDFP